jgi:hypothetical protein
MINLLIIIISLTVVSAAIFAAHIPPLWAPFTGSVILLALALAYLRRLNKESIRTSEVDKNPLSRFEALVGNEIKNIQRFTSKEELTPEWKEELEREQEFFFIKVEEVRNGMIDFIGMEKYIKIISPFALAERQLNRGLSAAMDGYDDEALTALRAGKDALEETLKIIHIERKY